MATLCCSTIPPKRKPRRATRTPQLWNIPTNLMWGTLSGCLLPPTIVKRRNAKVLPFIFSGLTRRRASVWRCFSEISATECGTTCASINSGNPGHWSLQSLRPYLIRLRFVNSFFSRSRNTKCFVLAASSQSRKKSEALGNSLLSLLREYVSASYS